MTTPLKSFLTLALAALITASCTLDPECTWEDMYPEFETYSVLDSLEQRDIILMGPEFDPSLGIAKEYIIRTDSAYKELLQFSKDEGCNYCNYPEIDFAKYVLVGFSTEINCQAINFIKVSQTPDGLRYSLKLVDQTQCNDLLCDNFSFNWVLIPTTYNTDTITFETGIARYFCDC
ncbi:MAG: hypothetical protein RL754_953 [Bacteroidota bacterium]|jgi:hypothetical protein